MEAPNILQAWRERFTTFVGNVAVRTREILTGQNEFTQHRVEMDARYMGAATTNSIQTAIASVDIYR